MKGECPHDTQQQSFCHDQQPWHFDPQQHMDKGMLEGLCDKHQIVIRARPYIDTSILMIRTIYM